MSDCTKAIRSAIGDDTISEAQATEILQRMQNSARAQASERGLRIDEAIKEIAGEMSAGAESLRLIDRRNRLLSVAAAKRNLDDVLKSTQPFAKTLKRKIIETDSQIRALEKKFTSPMVAKLEELGLMNEFNRQSHGLEAYREMENVEAGGTTPVVEGEIGRKIHEFMKFVLEGRLQRNAMQNRVGAYFPNRDNYHFKQTHSRERLWKLGGKMDDGHKSRTRAAFFDLVAKSDIDPRTYEGRDPSLFWSNVFDNIYNGHHVQGVDEGIDIDRFAGIHGSLATRLSQGRLIWFANAESQWRWSEAIGSKGWAESISSEISSAARSTVLMRNWGPNWQNNLALIAKKASDLSSDRVDSAEQAKAFQGFNIKAFTGLLSGEADASNRPTVTRIMRDGITLLHTMKMGGVVVSSIPDIVSVDNAMAMNGMGALDRFGAWIDGWRFSKDHLVGLNLVANSFIGSLHNRYGVDPASGIIGRWGHNLHNLNFFNKWNDMIQGVMAYAASWWLGKHANIEFGNLPEGLRTQFGHADIRASDWDAIRSIAKGIDKEHGAELHADGKKFVLVDQLNEVPDELIDRIATERNLTPSPANRRRIRDDLEIRLSSYFTQQVDNALNTPDIETKYYTTLGGSKAGTFPRLIADPLMMFKSFPISVALKMKRRAEDAGVSWANLKSGDWGKRQNSFVLSTARFVAMSAVAGYIAITTRDYLNGRTRRQLFNESGKPNVAVFLDALAKGGGLGIMGDFLFSEYDRQYKSALNTFAGPVFGMADQLGSIYSGARRQAMGEETNEQPLSELVSLAQNNIPFANLFYIKPLLNHFVFYNIREMLSPGVLKRAEKTAREMNYQDFWIEPSAVADIPISEPGRKIEALIP